VLTEVEFSMRELRKREGRLFEWIPNVKNREWIENAK
jgi:hypothetical protein